MAHSLQSGGRLQLAGLNAAFVLAGLAMLTAMVAAIVAWQPWDDPAAGMHDTPGIDVDTAGSADAGGE